MISMFRPAAHQPLLPSSEQDSLYRRLRWQIFLGIFFGYAGYYLVRKNFSLAMPTWWSKAIRAAIWASPCPALPSPTAFQIPDGRGV